MLVETERALRVARKNFYVRWLHEGDDRLLHAARTTTRVLEINARGVEYSDGYSTATASRSSPAG